MYTLVSARTVATLALAGLAAAVLTACGHGQHATSPATTTPTTSPVAAKPCNRPAPTTAAGYAAMFAHTPLAQWGGGDTAITVTLGHRHVWLFSDTLSTGRFVHSTAITQDGGCLHVSHAGAQLLPNGAASWYWIQTARAAGASTIRVKAVQVHATGTGPWDFTTGRARYAIVTVNQAGDVTFSRWLPGTHPATPPIGTLRRTGPGRVSYGQVIHRDIPVTGGYLVTTCQNWDDGQFHPLRSYAPLFSVGA